MNTYNPLRDGIVFVRCHGNGRRALASLVDQNRQTCPVCGVLAWVTLRGYIEAHYRPFDMRADKFIGYKPGTREWDIE